MNRETFISFVLMAVSWCLCSCVPSCDVGNGSPAITGEDMIARMAGELRDCMDLGGGGYKLVLAPVYSSSITGGGDCRMVREMSDGMSRAGIPTAWYLYVCEDTLTPECRRILRSEGAWHQLILPKSRSGNVGTIASDISLNTRVYLVGEGGRVIAHGDPRHMQDRLRLYRKVWPDSTVLCLSTREITVTGHSMDTVIYLRNEGDREGAVFEVMSSCSCTGVIPQGRTVSPGDSVAVSVRFKKTKPGSYTSHVLILTNSTEGIQKLTVSSYDKATDSVRKDSLPNRTI